MRINELTLLSGTDIPFPQGRLVIHVPSIKEIAFMGQVNFFSGCELFIFTKDKLRKQDRINLINYSDFDIIIAMLEDKTDETKQSRMNAMSLLTLLFPDRLTRIKEHRLIFEKDNQVQGFLDSTNLEPFQDILKKVFLLSNSKVNTDYRPAGDLAQKIADKMKAGRKKVSSQKKDQSFKSSFARQVSILSVGEHKDMNELMGYTIYQLKDQYQRFLLKQNYDLFIEQKLAGVKNVKASPHWMKDLNEKEKDALTGSVKRNNHRKNKGQK